MNLRIDLNVAIEKRKNLNATIVRETIFVQNIDFFDVSIDKNSDKKVIDDVITKFDNTFFERSRTIFDTNIEKNINFDDVTNEKIIDRNDEKDFDSKTDKTTNY